MSLKNHKRKLLKNLLSDKDVFPIPGSSIKFSNYFNSRADLYSSNYYIKYNKKINTPDSFKGVSLEKVQELIKPFESVKIFTIIPASLCKEID